MPSLTGKLKKLISFRSDYYDYSLVAVILLLTGFGLVMLYSTSSYSAELKTGNDMYYFAKQARISAGFLAAAILVSFVDYHILWKFGSAVYFISLISIALVLTPLGRTVNGARRWIRLGPLQMQPAEIAKLAVIIFIPVLIIRMGRKFRGWKAPLIVFTVGLVPALETLILTKNLSTAVIIMGITSVMIFVAHPRTFPFAALLLTGAVCVFLLVLLIRHSADASGNFRVRRVLAWLDPEKYSTEGGWQILQGLYALGSGGFFGKGLGNSTQKLGFGPEAQNDMAFSIVCEELGVFGALLLMFLFGYLLYRLFFVARNAPDLYGTLLCSGIFAHIMLQTVLNICVAVNLIPTTGITLPFISYGGTSVMFLMAEMGIALAVSRRIRLREKEKDLWGNVVRDYDF